MEETTKTCFKCNTEKPLSEYYKHKRMGDGHLNKCKDCTKKDTAERVSVLSKDPEWIKSEAIRHREKYHRLYSPTDEKVLDENYNRVWMTDEERYLREKENRKRWIENNPEKHSMTDKNYRNKYPEKYKAHSASQHLSKKQDYHNHHWSYNEEHWKDCIELHYKDHALLHRYITYDQERMMYRNRHGILLDTKQSHIDLLSEIKADQIEYTTTEY